MRVKRVISNNAVLTLDPDGQEMVALGRGLGHGRRPGDIIEPSRIEQVFIAGDADERLTRFLADVPLEYVRVAGRIADLAHERLGLKITQALILPMIGNVFSVYIFRQFFLTFVPNAGNKLRAHVTTTNGLYYIDGPTAITSSTWYHIAMTYAASSGELALYLNGQLDTNGYLSGTIITSTQPVRMSLLVSVSPGVLPIETSSTAMIARPPVP